MPSRPQAQALSLSHLLHVHIHGSGFVAYTLALLLAKNEASTALKMTLLPPTPTPAPQTPPSPSSDHDIRAFALNAASQATLDQVGVWQALRNTPNAITPVRGMMVFGDTYGRLAFSEPNAWIVDAGALRQALQAAVSQKGLLEVQAEATEERVSSLHAAHLHVVCEGRQSHLREELGLKIDRIDYPTCAIATRLQLAKPHGHIARQWFGKDGEVCALLPLGGDHPDATEVALVWSLPMTRAQHLYRASEAVFIDALAKTTTMVDTASFMPVALTAHRVLWPLQCTRVTPWAVQKGQALWVLAGDSAHAMHPLAGQGLNAGLGDARQLALTLLQHFAPPHHIPQAPHTPQAQKALRALRRALAGYARARMSATESLQHITDGLHLLFEHPSPFVQHARNFGLQALNHCKPLQRVLMRAASK